MNNIQKVSDSYLCSNCGACKAICPKNQITFKTSCAGRKYATVGKECVDCGICTKVCSSLHDEHGSKVDYEGEIKNIRIFRASDSHIFQNAQSGGAATAILTYLFDKFLIQGAVLCRMSYGETPDVSGVIIRDKDELFSTQKSCYTPVDLLSALRDLDKTITLAIVGLPCHIEGLTLLQKCSNKFQNIKYKIGLICDRTLCGGIQSAIASYSESTSDIMIHWRKKDFTKDGVYYPYEKAPVVVVDKNGNEKVVPNYVRFALKNMFTAPRCRVCNDKLNINADIVVGDPWGMKDIDKNHGESVVIIRTNVGKTIYNRALAGGYICKDREGNYNEVLSGQGIKERRKSAQLYRRAMSEIFSSEVEFEILKYSEFFSDIELNSASKSIQEFLELDTASIEAVLLKAKEQIAVSERAIRRNKNFLIRILSKFRYLIGL